jgi:hypothetical protein
MVKADKSASSAGSCLGPAIIFGMFCALFAGFAVLMYHVDNERERLVDTWRKHAYELGGAAAEAGLPPTANPYATRNYRHRHWNRGWADAKYGEEQTGSVRNSPPDVSPLPRPTNIPGYEKPGPTAVDSTDGDPED